MSFLKHLLFFVLILCVALTTNAQICDCQVDETCLLSTDGTREVCISNDEITAECSDCQPGYECRAEDYNFDGQWTAVCHCDNCEVVTCDGIECGPDSTCTRTIQDREVFGCVDNDAYSDCIHSCTDGLSHNNYCYVDATDSSQTTCGCLYSGQYPDCSGPPCPSDSDNYCRPTQECMMSKNFQYFCVEESETSEICPNCTEIPFGYCNAIAEDTVVCDCFYDGSFPDCSGVPCGRGECNTDEICVSNIACVDQEYYNTYCSNCTGEDASCEATFVQNEVVLTCQCASGGTFPNCNQLDCDGSYCSKEEQCIYSPQVHRSICVSYDVIVQNCESCISSTISNCVGVPGYPENTATCECNYGFDADNNKCLGMPCGQERCEDEQICLENSIPGGSRQCVPLQNINCGDCGDGTGETTCKAVRNSNGVNSGACFCVKPDPSNPGQCLPVVCGGEICRSQNQFCDLDRNRCVCHTGFSYSPVTGTCEVNPIGGSCIPCTSTNRVNCGCGAGKSCEVIGDAQTGNCVCAPGYSIIIPDDLQGPPNFDCQPIDPRPPVFYATCMAGGDPHFQTFDGRSFDFQERCEYVFAKSDEWEVRIRNNECDGFSNPDVSCVESVALHYAGHDIIMDSNGVTVDGAVVPVPYNLTDVGVTIEEWDATIVAELPDKTGISYFRNLATVRVLSLDKYRGKLTGLCGNYNNFPADDYRLRIGNLTNNVITFSRNWEFDPEFDASIYPDVSPCVSLPNPSNPFDICNTVEIAFAREICGNMVTTFLKDCSRYFDVTRAYASCVFDACRGFTEELDWIVVYFEMCATEEFVRNPYCEPACEEGEICAITFDGPQCVEPNADCDSCEEGQSCYRGVYPDGTSFARCVCDDDHVPDVNNPNVCVPKARCGSVNCDGEGEVCLTIEGPDNTRLYECNCDAGRSRNRLTRQCEPTSQPELFGTCVRCALEGQTGCGCSSANSTCVTASDNDLRGTCRCRPGFNYDQRLRRCVEIVVIPVQTPSLCTIAGDPHYYTFDKLPYDYQAKCDVALVQGNGIDIHLRQGECWPQWGTNAFVSCAKAVAFLTPNGDTIEINDDGAAFPPATDVPPTVYVEGAVVPSSSFTHDGVEITVTPDGFDFTVKFPNGVTLRFARYFFVSVLVPASFTNSINGTCGNFNGISTDDNTGDTYNLGSSPFFHSSNTQCPGSKRSERSEPAGFASDPNCELEATTVCAPLLELADTYPLCSGLADLSSFYFFCLYDYCAFPEVAGELVQSLVSSAEAQCIEATSIIEEFGPTSTTGSVSGSSTTGSVSGSSTTGSQSSGSASTTGSDSSGSVSGGGVSSTTGSPSGDASTTGQQGSTTGASTQGTTADSLSFGVKAVQVSFAIISVCIAIALW